MSKTIKSKLENKQHQQRKKMEENRPMIKMAIAYDFDGTLAKGNIQENSFLPKLGIDKNDFWRQVKKEAQDHNMSEILAYMRLIIHEADAKNTKITYDALKDHGKKCSFFNGVEDYFERINKYAKEQGVELEHYIISSGTKEMIEGTSIARHFKAIFASSFAFDNYGKPVWPATAIDYTSKTQYLYRISKGILNTWDSAEINKKIPDNEKSVRFENMIYIGDGETDIPAMTLLKSKKGVSIVVYDDENSEKVKQVKEMLNNNKANYAVPLDYSEGKPLDEIIKMIINKVVLDARYGKYQDDIFQETKDKKNRVIETQERDEKYYLDILGIKEFFIDSEDSNTICCIYLEKDSWDDGGYQTTFRMYRKMNKNDMDMIGKIKIGFDGQKKEKHTKDSLQKSFTTLRGTKFISCFKITNFNVTEDEKKALSFLLNDIRETELYDDCDIVKHSLKRGMPF